MFRRVLKYTSALTIGTSSVLYLHQHEWDFANIGVVRFGRAASTVGRIAFDYKWSLRDYKDNSPESKEMWSNVHQRSAERY